MSLAKPAEQPIPDLTGLPVNLDAEFAVLGSVLSRNEVLDQIGHLTPDHFAEPFHGRLWEVIARTIRAGRFAEPIALTEQFHDDPAFNELGGLRFLCDLIDQAPSPELAGHFADLTLDASLRRALVRLSADVAQEARTGEGEAVLASLEHRAAELARTGSSAPQGVAVGLTALEMVDAARDGRYRGVSTGLASLDRVTAGIREDDVWFIGGRTSMGKAQPLDARVLLADGRWTTMGALRLGDRLASVDGASSRVMAIHPQGEKQVYRITFSDGRSTEACAEHLWTVRSPHWAADRVLSTLEVAAVLRTVRHGKKLSVPVVSGLFGKEEDLAVDPYVLGALIGDGGLKYQTAFTSADPEIIAELERRMPADVQLKAIASSSYGYAFSSRIRRVRADGAPLPSSLRQALIGLSLMGCGSEGKFIPRQYLAAARTDRLDLLRGLMDTDGWAEKHGSVRFSTCSRQLAEDVVELVRSLGGMCSIKEKPGAFIYKGERRTGRMQYVCRIRHCNAEEFFCLSRKRERAVRRRLPARLTIAAVEPSRITEARCITVTHPTQLYVTDDYIVTHNSVLATVLARAIAEQGRGVVFNSLEMPLREVQARLVAEVSYDPERKYDAGFENVRYGDILRGRGTNEQHAMAQRAARKLTSLPLVVNDRGGLSVEDIRAQAQRQFRAWEKSGVSRGALIIDHIGLVRPHTKRGESKAAETADVVNELKGLAKYLKAPVIALCQVNRNTENRSDHKPTLGDLNWSGAIEQIADLICLLYREAYYLERSPNRDDQDRAAGVEHDIELLIHKNRSGPICTVKAFVDIASNVILDAPEEGRR